MGVNPHTMLRFHPLYTLHAIGPWLRDFYLHRYRRLGWLCLGVAALLQGGVLLWGPGRYLSSYTVFARATAVQPRNPLRAAALLNEMQTSSLQPESSLLGSALYLSSYLGSDGHRLEVARRCGLATSAVFWGRPSSPAPATPSTDKLLRRLRRALQIKSSSEGLVTMRAQTSDPALSAQLAQTSLQVLEERATLELRDLTSFRASSLVAARRRVREAEKHLLATERTLMQLGPAARPRAGVRAYLEIEEQLLYARARQAGTEMNLLLGGGSVQEQTRLQAEHAHLEGQVRLGNQRLAQLQDLLRQGAVAQRNTLNQRQEQMIRERVTDYVEAQQALARAEHAARLLPFHIVDTPLHPDLPESASALSLALQVLVSGIALTTVAGGGRDLLARLRGVLHTIRTDAPSPSG